MTASPPTPQPLSDEELAHIRNVYVTADTKDFVDRALKEIIGGLLATIDSQAAALRGRAVDLTPLDAAITEQIALKHSYCVGVLENIRRALRSPQAQTLQADTVTHIGNSGEAAPAPDPKPDGIGGEFASLPPVGPQAPGEQWREIATKLETFLQTEGDNSDDDSAVYAGKLEDRCRALLKALPSPPVPKPAAPDSDRLPGSMGMSRYKNGDEKRPESKPAEPDHIREPAKMLRNDATGCEPEGMGLTRWALIDLIKHWNMHGDGTWDSLAEAIIAAERGARK